MEKEAAAVGAPPLAPTQTGQPASREAPAAGSDFLTRMQQNGASEVDGYRGDSQKAAGSSRIVEGTWRDGNWAARQGDRTGDVVEEQRPARYGASGPQNCLYGTNRCSLYVHKLCSTIRSVFEFHPSLQAQHMNV